MGSNKKVNHTTLFLAVLLLFGFFQYACSSDEKPSETLSRNSFAEEKGGVQNTNEANDHAVIVYYFHGKYRCGTCKRIEQLTKEAVAESFANEMKTRLVEMKVINVDEPENKHFAKDYQLFTRSVVLSDTVNGKEKQWKNLQKVWELVRNEEAFKKYIRDEVTAYLS
jgi:thiol-disulfide isomerase/thioredoxin